MTSSSLLLLDQQLYPRYFKLYVWYKMILLCSEKIEQNYQN